MYTQDAHSQVPTTSLNILQKKKKSPRKGQSKPSSQLADQQMWESVLSPNSNTWYYQTFNPMKPFLSAHNDSAFQGLRWRPFTASTTWSFHLEIAGIEPQTSYMSSRCCSTEPQPFPHNSHGTTAASWSVGGCQRPWAISGLFVEYSRRGRGDCFFHSLHLLQKYKIVKEREERKGAQLRDKIHTHTKCEEMATHGLHCPVSHNLGIRQDININKFTIYKTCSISPNHVMLVISKYISHYNIKKAWAIAEFCNDKKLIFINNGRQTWAISKWAIRWWEFKFPHFVCLSCCCLFLKWLWGRFTFLHHINFLSRSCCYAWWIYLQCFQTQKLQNIFSG